MNSVQFILLCMNHVACPCMQLKLNIYYLDSLKILLSRLDYENKNYLH